MIEVEVQLSFNRAVKLIEEIISPRAYWLHNEAGNREWRVQVREGHTFIQVQDSKMLTYFLLKATT